MFEQYNNMDALQLQEKLEEKEKEHKEIFKQEKKIDKKVKKNLFWWFLIPIFGLLIFYVHLNRRKLNDQNSIDIRAVKENLIFLELEIQIIKKKLKNFPSN